MTSGYSISLIRDPARGTSQLYLRVAWTSAFKHVHILISSPHCYNVFKAAPIVAYSRSSNLSDFLVRAKLHNLTQHNQPWGSYPCGKNCLTCKYVSDGQTSYTFHFTGETRPTGETADQLTTHLISLNPPQSQSTFLLMIALVTTSHLSHQRS